MTRVRARRRETGVPRKSRKSSGISRSWTLAAVLATLAAAGTHAPPTWGTPSPREPNRERIVSRSVQETARHVLGPRRGHSARAAQARVLREKLAELRESLRSFESSSSPAGLTRIAASRRAAAEAHGALPGSPTDSASVKLAHRRMTAVFSQIDEFMSDRRRYRNAVPHLLEELDAALAAPESGASLTNTLTPVTAEIAR